MAKGFRVKMVKRSSAELNQILAQILTENGVKPWEYSLEGFEDERQCLEMQDGKWQVYFAERGQKRRCKSFDDHKEAACELLRRLGRTENQRASMAKAMELQWLPMKVVAEKKSVVTRIAVRSDVAIPVAFSPVDRKRTRKEMKVALAKANLAMRSVGDPYSRRAGKAARMAMKRWLAKELKKKEREEKEVKAKAQIHTFGLK